MAIVTTYDLSNPAFTDWEAAQTGALRNGDAASLSNGGFTFGGDWYSTPNGRAYSITVSTNASGDFLASNRYSNGQNIALAGLPNGNFVIAKQDADSVIYSVNSVNGGTITGDIDTNLTNSSNADVTALVSGGFAIASQLNFSGTDNDIRITLYNAAGALQTSWAVSGSLDNDHDAAIAGLNNGNIAVTWTRTVAGTDQVWYAVYKSDGTVVDAASAFDSPGGTDVKPIISSLADGGFMIGYVDRSWSPGSRDITLAQFNEYGIFESYTDVSNITGGTDPSFDSNPAMARLANGMLAVSWDNNYYAGDTDIQLALFDPKTMTTLALNSYEDTADRKQSAVAGFAGGHIALTSFNATDNSIDLVEAQIFRNITGDANANKITGGDDMENDITGAGGNDTLIGGALHDIIHGDEGADKLFGRAGDDLIYGGDGDDQIDGDVGADYMIGGLGNDTFYVDNVGDVVSDGTNQGIDTVIASVSFSLGPNVENLTLVGNAPLMGKGNGSANTIIGNNGNNTLYGNGGLDVLSGGNGNDTLYGGASSDTLTGGAGADRFVFDVLGPSADKDTITDFLSGTDKLAFSKAGFKAFAGYTSGNAINAADFAYGTTATTSSQHVIYDSATGALYYDSDGVGGAAQVQVAVLTSHPTVTLTDLIIL